MRYFVSEERNDATARDGEANCNDTHKPLVKNLLTHQGHFLSLVSNCNALGKGITTPAVEIAPVTRCTHGEARGACLYLTHSHTKKDG